MPHFEFAPPVWTALEYGLHGIAVTTKPAGAKEGGLTATYWLVPGTHHEAGEAE